MPNLVQHSQPEGCQSLRGALKLKVRRRTLRGDSLAQNQLDSRQEETKRSQPSRVASDDDFTSKQHAVIQMSPHASDNLTATSTSEFSRRPRKFNSTKTQIRFTDRFSSTLLCCLVYSLLISAPQNGQAQQQPVGEQQVSASQHHASDSLAQSQAPTASASTTTSSNAPNAATCFGGLQTFEKISMSSFENPNLNSAASANSNGGGGGSGGSFGSGVLVQQDDQALTSECINLCRSQSNCLSFVIDYNKFECKSYATTQQELQQEFAGRFQSARSTATGNVSTGGDSLNEPASGGYQAAASSTAYNFQQLLPSTSSNYFEKICLDGVANRNQFGDVCGQGRLWTIERVVDSFLDGFVEKEVTNVNGKDECSKLCLFEAQFVCRSADYDHHSRLCRLSKEDRRTQPQAMRYVANSNRQYLENQCATPGPSSCVYETKRNVGIISMDALKFAQTYQDCQMKCNQETTFNCRSYSFNQQRCFLSGDDSVSLSSNLIKLPQKQGWLFGEKKCLVELCSRGIFTYERITGYTLRSALSTSIDLMMPSSSRSSSSDGPNSLIDGLELEASQTRVRRLLPTGNGNSSSSLASSMMRMMMAAGVDSRQGADSLDPLHEAASYLARNTRTVGASSQLATANNNLAITEHCRHSCDLGYLNCPAFTIDHKNNRCQRLDRNSQGRHHELVARDGFAYYEKICLRVPEIMSMCQDKYWIFERVIGYELAPRLYDKTLKFVQSRRDCEEYCLEEKQFQCRSALYNDETSDCKLSRYDRRLALQDGAYYRNYNLRISYLENNCIRDRQLEGSKQCHYEQARDEPAYPTYTERIESANPAAMGLPASDSLSRLVDQLPGGGSGGGGNHSFRPTERHGAALCEQLCNDNSKFECHSFGYYASTSQCFLSGDDSISAGDLATTPSTGFVYYEKRCRLANGNETEELRPTQNNRANGQQLTTPTSSLNPYSTSLPPNTPVDDSSANRDTNLQQQPGSSGRPMLNQSQPTTTTTATNSATMPTSVDQTNPDMYKCGVGHTFVYQRIAGFEPIGGYLALLLKNNEQPGIVAECSELCRRAFECRAFVVDYSSNQCFAMLENSSVGLLNLRQTLAKDYFEGFCIADHLLQTSPHSSCRNRTWIMDKIVDQAVFGVQHQKLLLHSDRVQCRRACLEERLFMCKSAMFDGTTNECKLYTIDRESIPQMRLVFTKGVDFFENQCQISSSSCPYDAIERDMTITTITKSVQAHSTFDCELACNLETSFNCRSYTYLDQYPTLANLCLLSSDSRSTSQRGSIREHPRTLYAERNCYYRRPRFPGGNRYDPLQHAPPDLESNNYTPSPAANPATGPDPYPPAVAPMRHFTEQEATAPPKPNQRPPGVPTNGYELIGPLPVPLASQQCEPHQFTFERTFGYDFKPAFKERAPIAPTIGIATGCQQECLRRGDKCQSFVVDYALPYQSCFLLETQAGANKRALVRSPNSAYFEKVCLPRTGLNSEPAQTPLQPPPEPIFSHSPLTMAGKPPLDPGQSLDISPSYSTEPWSLQASPPPQASQLPYYLQQQHLAQNYPSRACAKLWSFERFVNHNFTAPADRLIEESLTRAQCEAQCLNEASFTCRSATYDYGSKICRLFRSSRRTMLSHFVDLDPNSLGSLLSATSSEGSPASMSNVTSMSLANSHPGTAHVLLMTDSSTTEPIQTAASNELGQTRRGGARQLVTPANMPTSAEPAPGVARNIDYLENTCTPEPSSCQYRQIYDQFSPYIDKVNHASSLGDCQRQCDQERLFTCKSVNFDAISKNCMLVNEDLISLAHTQQQQQQSAGGNPNGSLLPKRNTIYSEKGNCELISVQCNSQEMLVAINFDAPFRGRIMAKGNPEQCYILGDGQTSLQFSIVFGPKCNSRQEGHNTFVNEVVIQQHPVIMTESDKTIRVMCAFEAPDQTISLNGSPGRDNRTTGGIDVGAPSDSARTRHDKQQFNSVVSNKAPPPSVVLRILDQNGRDASMINLGDDLQLKIQMQMIDGKASALGIFARNLAARSSNGESLLLIDNDGCPVDPLVFPALEVNPKDGRSLVSTFKAFRFPSSGLVNFEVQIRFCPERCQPVECNRSNQRSLSYGRRRKRQTTMEEADLDSAASPPATSRSGLMSMGREPILQSVSEPQVQQMLAQPSMALDSLSTVMKPGKAFEYVRKLMQIQPETEPATHVNAGVSNGEQLSSQSLEADQSNSPAGMADGNPVQNEDFISHSQASGSTTSNMDNQQVGTTGTVSVDQQLQIISDQYSQSDPGQNKASSDQFSPSISPPIQRPLADNHSQTSTLQQLKPIQAPYGNFDSTLSIKIQPELNADGTQIAQTPQGPAQGDGSQPRQEIAADQKDMPLRFSILVAENQLQTNSNGQISAIEQPPTIMNSTSMDMDHIVIPGKKGQFEDSPESVANMQIGGGLTTMTTTGNADLDPNYSNLSNLGRSHEPNKRNASYEQTFDAQPSNSITSEAYINEHNNRLETFSNLNPNRGQQVANKVHNHNQNQSPNLESNAELSAAAISHDCQLEASASRSRLRAIIWTGSVVIGLNVCLVVLSLFLYFRKHHLRQNHTIVRSPSDCGTTTRSDGIVSSRFGASGTNRWPSVILKSKNDLGTSLKTHEQFFCKLNSKPANGFDSRLEQEFNWPNMSASSSRSTLSSLASPIPSTNIRISQMRPSLKSSPFDSHSSLRNGNFIPDRETHKELDESAIEGRFSSRYTNNIDMLHSERF